MKEKKDFKAKLLFSLRHLNLRQLGAALIIGNAVYFSYANYFQHDISPKTLATQHYSNDNIQLIK